TMAGRSLPPRTRSSRRPTGSTRQRRAGARDRAARSTESPGATRPGPRGALFVALTTPLLRPVDVALQPRADPLFQRREWHDQHAPLVRILEQRRQVMAQENTAASEWRVGIEHHAMPGCSVRVGPVNVARAAPARIEPRAAVKALRRQRA